MHNEQKFDEILGENLVIKIRQISVKKTEKIRAGIKFGATCMARLPGKTEWEEIIRIDNSKHKGQEGSHIHFTHKKSKKNTDPVEYDDSLQDPYKAIEYIENYIKKQFPYLLDQ